MLVLLETAETHTRFAGLFLFQLTRETRSAPGRKLVNELAEQLLLGA